MPLHQEINSVFIEGNVIVTWQFHNLEQREYASFVFDHM